MHIWFGGSCPRMPTLSVQAPERSPAVGKLRHAAGQLVSLVQRALPGDLWLTRMNIASLVFWIVYYLLVDGPGAVTSLVLGLAVAVSAEMRMRRLSRACLGLELLAIPVVGVVAGPLEMVPVIGGAMFSTGVALFSGERLTMAFLAGALSWLLYTSLIGATLGVVSAVVASTALSIRIAHQLFAKTN